MPRQGFDIGTPQDTKAATASVDPPPSLKLVQQSAYDLPRRTKFSRQILMSCFDASIVSAEGQESLRQTDVETQESDLVDDPEEIADNPAEGGEDEPPEIRRTGNKVVEQSARHSDRLNISLSDSFGLILLVTHEAGGGESAALAGRHTVQDDLASLFRDLLHAHAAGEQNKKALRRLARAKDTAAFGDLYDLASTVQLVTHLAGKQDEEWKLFKPAFSTHGRAPRIGSFGA